MLSPLLTEIAGDCFEEDTLPLTFKHAIVCLVLAETLIFTSSVNFYSVTHLLFLSKVTVKIWSLHL